MKSKVCSVMTKMMIWATKAALKTVLTHFDSVSVGEFFQRVGESVIPGGEEDGLLLAVWPYSSCLKVQASPFGQ